MRAKGRIHRVFASAESRVPEKRHGLERAFLVKVVGVARCPDVGRQVAAPDNLHGRKLVIESRRCRKRCVLIVSDAQDGCARWDAGAGNGEAHVAGLKPSLT